MKEFNLDAALNGEPVKLREGSKAYVVGKIPSNLTYPDNELLDYPLIGVILNKTGHLTGTEIHWTINGKVFEDGKMHGADIICMWEEPKISIEDLPKPFYPRDGDIYYYISHSFGSIGECQFEINNIVDKNRRMLGQCFATQKDAQKWLDFMKSMME